MLSLIVFFATFLTGYVLVFASFRTNTGSGFHITYEAGPILDKTAVKNAINSLGAVECVTFDYDTDDYATIKANATGVDTHTYEDTHDKNTAAPNAKKKHT